MPLPSATHRTGVPAQFVVALCAIALSVAVLSVSAAPVAAQDLGSRIAAVRSAQKSAEAAMRAQDRVLLNLTAQRKAASKQLKPLQRTVKQAASELAVVKSVVAERKSRLAEKEALWTGPEASPPTEWKARLSAIRKDLRVAENRRENIAAQARTAERAVKAKKAQVERLKRQVKATTSRQRGAAGSLAAYISQMTALARLKIAEQANVSLAEGGTYSWPTTGRISQTYGCTGVVFNPKRGSCTHFHDGIDVVDGYGTPVRSIAAGVVAYSGWNPYDKEGRAYVVDVVHAHGYVSRYGHLIPGNQVRAGDLVHTGQVIGKMGSTGKSTGTHLHFEVLRNGKDVNPLDLLPAGVVQVDKTSTKAGEAQQEKAARETDRAERAKVRAAKEWQPPAKAFSYAKDKPVATCTPAGADKKTNSGKKAKDGAKKSKAKSGADQAAPQAEAVECEPTGLFVPNGGDSLPAIPKPYRGADPAPG